MSNGSFLLGLGILFLAAGAILLAISHRQQVRGRSGPAGPLGASPGRSWPQVGDCAILLCPQGDGRSRPCRRWRRRAVAPEPCKSPAGPRGAVQVHPQARPSSLAPVQSSPGGRSLGGPSVPGPPQLRQPLPGLQVVLRALCAGPGAAAPAAPTAARLPRSCSSWCGQHGLEPGPQPRWMLAPGGRRGRTWRSWWSRASCPAAAAAPPAPPRASVPPRA